MHRVLGSMGTTMLVLAAFVLVGCGSAKVDVKTGEEETPARKPFEAPALGGGGANDGGGLSAEDEELIVPGSNFGKAPPVAQPGKKKGKKGKGGGDTAIPYTDAVAEQMEGLAWGMSTKKVIAVFEQRVKEKFQEELSAAAGDALAEDGIRTKMIRESSKLRKSYVEFKGQRTGFEGHMIAAEFSHNNGESMLMWDAGKYVEYLFFFNGRFWKRLRAFRVDSFQSEITFMDFLGTLEARFGEGKEYFTDEGGIDKIMWRDEDTYVAALDRSSFFGAFGLRFSAAVTETYLAELRPNKGREDGRVGEDISSMVDSVTSGGTLADRDSSVIDSYTGDSLGHDSSVDMTHSVVGDKKKKEEKKEDKAKEEAPAKDKPAKEAAPDKDFVDDLF